MDINSDIELYSYKNKRGRPRIFDSPDEMAEIWDKYVAFCLSNPLLEQTIQKRKITRDEEIIDKVDKEHIRPLTLTGFCLFAEITDESFRNYEKNEQYFGVTSHIREAIYYQKFSGAACGMYNANIIALDLGLRNKERDDQDNEITITII